MKQLQYVRFDKTVLKSCNISRSPSLQMIQIQRAKKWSHTVYMYNYNNAMFLYGKSSAAAAKIEPFNFCLSPEI